MSQQPCRLSGIVHEIGKTQTFASGFCKRELVVCDNPAAQYPNYAVFEFVKEHAATLDTLRVGERVTVSFYPDARRWEPTDGRPARWFSSNRAVKFERPQEAAATAAQPQSQPAPPTEQTLSLDDAIADDIPF